MPSTNEEQLILELINDARLNPMGDAALYISAYTPALTSQDASIQQALTFFGVSGSLLLSQYQALTPAQPLAFNEALRTSAVGHSQAMSDAGQQSHQLPGEPDPGARMTAAGYSWISWGENIYAYAKSALYAHAGFMVDWGGPVGGMQSPAGHRDNIMSTSFREVGIGVVDSVANGLGPMVVTEDFATHNTSGVFVLGVSYDDTDHNSFYSLGEGRSALAVAIGATNTTSSSSGGYSLYTSATGAQTITLSGADLASPVQMIATLVNGSNYKLDVVDGHILHTSLSGVISGGVDTVAGLGLTGLSLTTGAGAQKLIGTAGADTLNGGTGRDTAVYSGARASYTVTRSGATVTVSGGADGTDTLKSIEALKFSDATVSLTTNRSDFNGNGRSDILFRNDAAGGDTGFYQFNADGSFAGWRSIGSSSTAYSVVGAADFSGDGVADVLFRNNATGDTGFYQLASDGSFQGWRSIGSSSAAYAIVGVGDFNGDDVSDVLFRNSSNGDVGFYQLNSGGSFNSWHGLGNALSAYTVAGVGDFNADGVADVLFRNLTTGDTGFDQLNSDGSLQGWHGIGSSSTAYAIVGVGDFNGDGVSDVLFRNNTTGGDTGFYQLNGDGSFQGWHSVGSSSTAYSVVGTGDYNGDGVSDVMFRNAANGDTGFYQLASNGSFQGWHAIGLTSTAYSVVG